MSVRFETEPLVQNRFEISLKIVLNWKHLNFKNPLVFLTLNTENNVHVPHIKRDGTRRIEFTPHLSLKYCEPSVKTVGTLAKILHILTYSRSLLKVLI